MHTLGRLENAELTRSGDLRVHFTIPDEIALQEALKGLSDKVLVIDVKEYKEKRSLNANAYFWKLCDLIAKKLGSDKDTIYLMELKNHGVFDWLEVIEEGVRYIKPLYRYVEEDHRFYSELIDPEGRPYTAVMVALKCYRGSSTFDSKEMSELIDGAVNEAHDLGIETLSDIEINRLVERWKPHDEQVSLEED